MQCTHACREGQEYQTISSVAIENDEKTVEDPSSSDQLPHTARCRDRFRDIVRYPTEMIARKTDLRQLTVLSDANQQASFVQFSMHPNEHAYELHTSFLRTCHHVCNRVINMNIHAV